jgi:hypothetical protein
MEVFRLTTVIGKKYKHAEYTQRMGRYPNEKYYADNVRDVGTLVEIKEGGFSDGRWRIDVFEKDGERIEVVYSYAGRTCFIAMDEE